MARLRKKSKNLSSTKSRKSSSIEQNTTNNDVLGGFTRIKKKDRNIRTALSSSTSKNKQSCSDISVNKIDFVDAIKNIQTFKQDVINTTTFSTHALVDCTAWTAPLKEHLQEGFANHFKRVIKKFDQVKVLKSNDPNFYNAVTLTTSDGVTFYMAYGPKRDNMNYFKFEVTFSKLTDNCQNEIGLFAKGVFGNHYTDIFLSKNVRITKIELALDFFGIEVHQLIMKFSKARAYHHIKDGGQYSNYKRSGSNKGDSLKVYDKRLEMEKYPNRNQTVIDRIGDSWKDIPITRVELVKKTNGLNVNFFDLPNADFGIGRIEIYHADILKLMGPAIFYMIDAIGLAETLKQLPNEQCKQLTHLLVEHRLDFDIDMLKETFKEALQSITNFFISIDSISTSQRK
jgi:hypothetical protein